MTLAGLSGIVQLKSKVNVLYKHEKLCRSDKGEFGMNWGIKAAMGVLVLYVIANELIDAMITGTGTGDTLIQTVGPLLLAIAALLVFIRIGTGGGR